MENQNSNPEETGKKKFNLFDFLFGWMKPTPKEEPIKTQNEDGSPRDPAEIEAEKNAREEAKAKAPKKSKAGMFTFLGILVLIIGIILLVVFGKPFSPSKDGKEKAKTEQTTKPGTQPTQPGGGNTQPGGGNQITFTYDQSFDFSKMDKQTQDNLKSWETTGTINVYTDEIILKTEVKNYNGKTMIWLQIEGSKGKVKNIFTEPNNIKIQL